MVIAAAATPPLLAPILAPYEMVRTIGSRPSLLHVVRQAAPGAAPKLFVAERFAGAAKAAEAQWATFLSEARRISTLASSNVARVRELAVRGDDLVAFWDFIDGERLGETWLSGMPLEVSLRMVLDVLSGVGAIHGLRDAKQQPMEMAHGELSPATIVVGLDGAARVLHAIARRMPGARTEAASLGYLAPEVHAGEAYDARADVFGAGVLLWEAVSGKRLFSEGDAAAIVARVRGGSVPAAAVPAGAAWARPLVGVAAKALAPSPSDRWPTASVMAAEIRKAVGLKLASASAAATFAETAIGPRVKARRRELESGIAANAWVPEAGCPDADIELVVDAGEPSAPISVIPEPIDDAVVVAPSPPPLPERLPQPVPPVAGRPYPADDANVTHDFAAAIDVPISIVPPPADPFEVSPTSIETTGSFHHDDGAARRRRVAVLGGVGALGLIVFALAGWRAVHRGAGASPSAGYPSHPVATAGPARPPAAAPAAAPVASSAAAPIDPIAPTPAVPVAASRTQGPPPAVSSAPAPKPSSTVAASQKPSSPPMARPKPRSNSGYDPGAL